jgi:2-iminobutanoate/2-iminopropanoate deaminase
MTAPPVGPYRPLVRTGDLVVCSGQLGLRPGAAGPELVPGGVVAQTDQALANVTELLASEGLGWSHVVKVTAFLADIADYGVFNDRYVAALGGSRPARSVVAVAGLPLGALVEVEVWASARHPA